MGWALVDMGGCERGIDGCAQADRLCRESRTSSGYKK